MKLIAAVAVAIFASAWLPARGQFGDAIAGPTLFTEAESRANFNGSQFIWPFTEIDTNHAGSTLRGLFINNNEALGSLPGQGVGQNLVTLAPCAVNQPHVHPRGTEISYVTAGPLFFGFFEENVNGAGTAGGRFVSGNVSTGNTVVIPQGLMHLAHNLQCKEGQFLASFPTSDPGTLTIASSFFKLPLNTLRATLGLTNDVITSLINPITNNPNPSQDPVCLQQCGLPPAGPVPVSAPAGSYVASPGDSDGE